MAQPDRGETIDLFARLRGGTDPACRDALCERFDLDPTAGPHPLQGQPAEGRAGLGARGDVDLLLNEPTAGLDPLMEAVFQECIREAKEASHIPAQVEALADPCLDRPAGPRGGVRQAGRAAPPDPHHRHRDHRPGRRGPGDAARVHDYRAENGQVRVDVDGDRLPDAVRRLGELDLCALTTSNSSCCATTAANWHTGATRRWADLMTASALDAPTRIRPGGTLTGTGTLLRFILRRDRFRFPAWTVGLTALGVTSAPP
ncbi:hypothetical protein [Actinomadura rugatobispora]|uniref:Uncharacterized protein n=1 Tax=Actinomadura rugatobispora TaxID=1994 RepID=A0ABW1A6D5_9ACTN